MRQICLSRYRVGAGVKKVSVCVRKMVLSKKCVQLLMDKQGGNVRQGVDSVNVREDLMVKQAGSTLEVQEQEQDMGLDQSIAQQVKFTKKDQMEFIVGSRHRRPDWRSWRMRKGTQR